MLVVESHGHTSIANVIAEEAAGVGVNGVALCAANGSVVQVVGDFAMVTSDDACTVERYGETILGLVAVGTGEVKDIVFAVVVGSHDESA